MHIECIIGNRVLGPVQGHVPLCARSFHAMPWVQNPPVPLTTVGCGWHIRCPSPPDIPFQQIAPRFDGLEVRSWPDKELVCSTSDQLRSNLKAMQQAVSPEPFSER